MMWWAGVAFADCPTPVPAVEVTTLVARAEAALAAGDDEAVDALYRGVRDGLPCVRETLSTMDAAGLHRLAGVIAFMDRDSAAMGASFAAAHGAEAALVMPSTWFPADHPAAIAWSEATPLPPTRDLAVPDRVVSWVDGRRSDRMSAAAPAIVQLTSAHGEVVWTGYVAPSDPLPDWRSVADGLPPLGLRDFETIRARRFRPVTTPLAVGAVGAGVAAGGLAVAGALLRADLFSHPADSSAENEARAAVVNGVGGAAVGAAGVGIVALTASVLSVRW